MFEQQTPTCHEQRKVKDDCSNMPVKSVSSRRRSRSEVAVAWHWRRELPVRRSKKKANLEAAGQDGLECNYGSRTTSILAQWILDCVERKSR